MYILRQCCFIEFWQVNLYWTLSGDNSIFPTLHKKLNSDDFWEIFIQTLDK